VNDKQADIAKVPSSLLKRASKAASVLVSGSLLSQVVLIAASPIITRLFTPSEFAVLNVYTSITALFTAFVILRLDIALFTVSRSVASSLSVVAAVVAAVLSLVVGIGFFTVCWVSDISFATIDLWMMSLLVAVGLFGSSVFAMISSVAVMHGAYRATASVRITQSIAGIAVQITAGLLHFAAVGLIIGYLVSQSVGITRLWLITKHQGRNRNRYVLRHSRQFIAKYVFGRFRDFTLFSAPSSIVNRFSGNMTVVLFAAVYDLKTAGLLALAYRSANAPLLAIARGTAQVFQKEYAKPGAQTRRQVIIAFLAGLSLIGLVPTLVLIFAGPQLFALVFGATWRESGVYAALLAPAFIVQFIAYPVTQSFSLSDNNRQQLIWDVARSLAILILFGGLELYQVGAFPGVIAISVLLTIIYGTQIVMAVRISSRMPAAGAGIPRRIGKRT